MEIYINLVNRKGNKFASFYYITTQTSLEEAIEETKQFILDFIAQDIEVSLAYEGRIVVYPYMT